MTPPLLPTDIKSINRAVDNYLIADNVKQTDIKLQQLERATAQRIAPILKRQGTITLREFERLEGIFQEETRQDNLNHAFSLAQLGTRDDFIKALSGPMSIASSLGGQTLSAQLGIKLSFNPVDPATHAYLQERAAESVTGIDDTTRSRLNTIIEKDYGEGKTYQQIARDLKNDFAEYSLPGGGERAKLIAVTELGNAHEGTKENMVRQIAQAGFKMKKFWLTLKDEKVCPICRMNMADGWIPIDQPHSSGHDRSKGHPGCRCPELYRADLPDATGPQGDFAVKVSAFESDRSAEIITLEESAEIEYAQLDSPQFTGEPTAPTPPEEDESEQIATTKFVKRIVAALELQKGDKGDPGKDGKDGYTPIKGKDYFDGEPGYTPVKGKDYFDGKDSTVPGPPGEDSTVPGPKGDPGYTPVKGVDYQDGKDGESIKGDPGEPGPGLPPGGEPGQVPVKKSREDYDTEWQYPTGGVMWTGGNSGTQPDPATEVPLIEAGAGAIGASDKYAREDHVHPAFGGGGETPSDDDPLMDSTADPGISDEYSRGDHVHPSDTTKSDTTHNHDLAYLGLTAKAADSDKLDNHDSTYFSEATHTHATLPTADEKAALTGTSGTAPSAANPLIDDADTRLTDNRTDAAAMHSVTDTATVNLTLTGDALSADVIPGGVDHNSLDGLDGGSAGEYNHLTNAEYSGLTDKILSSLLTEQGDIIYASGVATPAVLAHGSIAGLPLLTGGHGANPTWGGLFALLGTGATDLPTYGAEFLDADNWTSADWTGSFAAGWTHTPGNTTVLSHDHIAVGTTKYQIAYTVTGRTAGSFTITFGGQTSDVISSTGTWGPTATGTGVLQITPTSLFDGKIEISIKTITAVSTPLITLYDSGSVSRFEIRAIIASYNTYLGLNAGAYTTTGTANLGVGYLALYRNTTGYQNVAIGGNALEYNTTGAYNCAVSRYALGKNTTGIKNVAIANTALYENTTGWGNVGVGYDAGRSITTGNNNLFFGIAAGYNASQKIDAVNTVGLGPSVYTTKDNQVVIGYTNIIETLLRGNVGIFNDYTAPTARLHIRAGSATAGTAPIKLTSGTVLATPEAGAIEYDGTDFHVTPASTRYRVITTKDPYDMEFIVDGGSAVPTTGIKGHLTVPSTGTITGWTLLADAAGAIVIDVHKCTYSNFPTTSSCMGGSPPTISATNQKAQATGLSIAVTAGDILEFHVDSVTTITRCTISLQMKRS